MQFINEKKQIFSLLRLRIPSKNVLKNHFFPVLRNSAIVRELHTYGISLPLTQKKIASVFNFVQHRHLGKKLLGYAEEIAKKNNLKKIAVISGIGVRNYYCKLGYRLKDTYMIKNLN